MPSRWPNPSALQIDAVTNTLVAVTMRHRSPASRCRCTSARGGPDRRPDHCVHELRAPRVASLARQGSLHRPRRFLATLAPAMPRRVSRSDEASR
ncbi:hypothetical protein WS71_03895 [Burkholderia mayonis]|uniref:Uncharacterized protein n=1 Tax=Burkholderia mayonis TaxID=1385591 RepID=A0A1B4FSB8_9BURK|nr:hypothetical protein WS71_03895 [Burkholderia mayonis]